MSKISLADLMELSAAERMQLVVGVGFIFTDDLTALAHEYPDTHFAGVDYALALDSRDMDMMVSLFTPDVRVGREERGRDALRVWFVKTLSEPKVSVQVLGKRL